MSLTEEQVLRFESAEVGEPEAVTSAEEAIDLPGAHLRQYRRLFDAARRSVVRSRIIEVVSEIDSHLTETQRDLEHTSLTDRAWDRLRSLFGELERLVGTTIPRRGRWGDFSRHLYFASEGDFDDIVNMDWPSVKANVQENLYDDDEPIPVPLTDLGLLAKTKPTGPVSTGLHWERLDDGGFERLIFELMRTTDGYENVNLLMNTHAPDKGRDVHAQRVVTDPLAGTIRQRIIVQCKHYRAQSVSRNEAITSLETAKLWEPPRLDTFIIATSGRFASGAVEWAEKRNEDREVPMVFLWPESHLEALLAQRPALVAQFNLR